MPPVTALTHLQKTTERKAMPEFLLDFTCTGTARLTADDLATAAREFTEFLNCYDPGIAVSGQGMSGHITELSLGLTCENQAALAVGEVDGEEVTADLDGMITPAVCARTGQNRNCKEVYDEARGDGHLGLCPHCADVTGR